MTTAKETRSKSNDDYECLVIQEHPEGFFVHISYYLDLDNEYASFSASSEKSKSEALHALLTQMERTHLNRLKLVWDALHETPETATARESK